MQLGDRVLLEREREMTALARSLEGLGAGAGRSVVVEGEAGIGKTELLRFACAEATRRDIRVLKARGTELERGFPFGIVRQWLEPVVMATPASEREALLRGAAAPARGAIGLSSDHSESGPAAVLSDPSFVVLNGLFWLVANLAERAPLLLALDDAQWGDAASLRFVRFLLPRLEDVPVLLLATVRTTDQRADLDVTLDWDGDPAAVVLRPRLLSEAATREVVGRLFAADADQSFSLACHEVSGGNPFLLGELLDELRTEGVGGGPADAAAVLEVAPLQLRRSVLVRLARLSPQARAVAVAVAVLGDDARLPTTASIVGLDSVRAATAADELVAAGVLDAGRPLRFRHPLLRTAVEADMSPSELAAAHHRAAEVLAEEGASPERVAIHLLGSEPIGDPRAVDTLIVAARRALDAAAPEAALRFIKRALSEPPSPGLRPELVRLLIAAGWRSGDRAAAEEAGIDPVEELTVSDEQLLSSAWHLAMFLLVAGRADELADLLDRAVAVARERGEVELALRLDSILASFGLLSPAQARPRLAGYEGALPPDGASRRLWLALEGWWASYLGGSAEGAGELAREAIADGRLIEEQSDSPAPSWAILVLARSEQLDLAEDRIAAFAAYARRHGAASMRANASYLRGYVEYLRGDIAAAEADVRGAVEALRESGVIAAVPMFVAMHVETLIERGQPEEAERELADLGWTGPLPRNYWWTPLLVSRARLHRETRRLERAHTDLLTARSMNEEAGITIPYLALGSQLALVLAAKDRRQEALAAAQAELELAQAWGAPAAFGGALRVLGLVAGGEQGLALIADAVELLDASPVALEHMRALLDLGAALRRANRRADARAPLRKALELARTGGAVAIANRAHSELLATGERIAPLSWGGAADLTASERRATELAAGGLTNREIAQTLFLTVKTVEGHLSRAYRKLGVTSRAQLPEALQGESGKTGPQT